MTTALTLDDLRGFLVRLPKGFEKAVIAGGAPRDIILGASVKDIDLFFPVEGLDFLSAEAVIQSAFPEAKQEFPEFLNSHYSRPEIVSVWATGEALKGVPVQVIVVAQPQDRILSSLDLGICQVGVSSEGVHSTSAFEEDMAQKRISVRRCEDHRQAERTAKRIVRINSKHPALTPDWGEFGYLRSTPYGLRN